MSGAQPSLADFAGPGQLTLTSAEDAPTKDFPDPPGWKRKRAAGRGGVVAWLGDGVLVDVQECHTRERRVWEVLAVHDGLTSHVATCESERAAVEAAAGFMQAGSGREWDKTKGDWE